MIMMMIMEVVMLALVMLSMVGSRKEGKWGRQLGGYIIIIINQQLAPKPTTNGCQHRVRDG